MSAPCSAARRPTRPDGPNDPGPAPPGTSLGRRRRFPCGLLSLQPGQCIVDRAQQFHATGRQRDGVGRDHHPEAFSCLLAGGGVKGGFKYGETDATGTKVKDKLVNVQDFNATIAAALGLPWNLTVMSPSQRPFQIADKGKPIAEVFA